MIVKNSKFSVLLLLTVIFLSPAIAALLVYKYPLFLPKGKLQHGELLAKPELLPFLAQSEQSSQKKQSNKKWQLVLWNNESCGQRCLRKLDELARIRLGLGRRLYMLDLTLLLPADQKMSQAMMTELRENDIRVIKLTEPRATIHKLLSTRSKSQIFIMDPNSYLILSYAMDAKPQHIFKDIGLLLHAAEKKYG